jgi:hypothetical protein
MAVENRDRQCGHTAARSPGWLRMLTDTGEKQEDGPGPDDLFPERTEVNRCQAKAGF